MSAAGDEASKQIADQEMLVERQRGVAAKLDAVGQTRIAGEAHGLLGEMQDELTRLKEQRETDASLDNVTRDCPL